jgi:uncharacterized RDD family membrane protein YckC
MDDYYSLLGIEPGASTDEIRSAYRDRKAAIDAANGDGGTKGEAARLNKAWNVLSDPYQRGRYDQQRADAEENGELVDGDDIEVVDAPSGRATRTNPRTSRQMPAPTLTPPPGTRWPLPKQRLIAMAIDLVVLLAFVLGASFVANSIADSQKSDVVHAVDNYQKQIDQANKDLTAAKNQLSADKKANNTEVPADQKKVDDLNAQIKDLQTKHDDEASKLTPYYFGAVAVAFLLGFLYLVIPSIMSGRTLGKRTQHLKVVRQDGSPLRAGDAIKRYGLLVIVTFALYILLRELAAVIVLVGVTTWMRNPNFQGLHDRFAKTIVVSDAE